MFRSNFVSFVFRITISLSLLLSTAAPAFAEMQYPADSALNNPYDYVSNNALANNNTADSNITITSAVLNENAYSSDTSQCTAAATDENGVAKTNNATLSFSMNKYGHVDGADDGDYFKYDLITTLTNLQTNTIVTETNNYGVKIKKPIKKFLNVVPNTLSSLCPGHDGGTYGNGGPFDIGARIRASHLNYDQATGEQLFTIDSVPWTTFFSSKSTVLSYLCYSHDGNQCDSRVYKYDGVYLGNGDGNCKMDISYDSIAIFTDFVSDKKHSFVSGHDTPSVGLPNFHAFTGPYFDPITDPSASAYSGAYGTLATRQNYAFVTDASGTGQRVSPAQTDGNRLTSWPYLFPMGTVIYNLGRTHVTSTIPNKNYVDVWMSMYQDSVSLYNYGGKTYYFNPYMYSSKSHPNIAHSSVGDTNVTDNDLRLIVNMLMMITGKENEDQSHEKSVKDITAPNQPEVVKGKKGFTFTGKDVGTKVNFQLSQTGVYSKTTSNPVVFNDIILTSKTTRYLYTYDDNAAGTLSYSVNCLGLPVVSGNTHEIVPDAADGSVYIPYNISVTSKYLHIAAVDQAGNVSEVTTVEIPHTEDLTVQKVFVDFENRYFLRPQSIIFDAFAGSETVSSGDCTANEDNDYTCTINELLAYDTNGSELTYTVKERNTPRAYTASEPSVVIAQDNSITVTNTLVTRSITVNKVWSDGNNQDGIRPDNIRFTLFCGSTECGDNPYTIAKDDNWTITVPDIPTYDENGQEYTYSIVELGIP